MKRFAHLMGISLVLICAVFSAYGQNDPETQIIDPTSIQLTVVAQGFTDLLYVTHAGGDSERLFAVEQRGKIWIVENGSKSEEPFLDLSSLISPDAVAASWTERGLLGLAFHPDYQDNGWFYVNYTDIDGNTVIARYTVSSDNPAAADPDSAEIFLQQVQPYPNHNGGQLAFGPEGYLYIGLGDGGSAGDPHGNGQSLSTFLGKILRIDVNVEEGYEIPPDNPFIDDPDLAPEIWAYGLRNPWRFSFDRETGDLYIGDVGQNLWEEVNFQPTDSEGGENYGWNFYEGTHRYSDAEPEGELILPFVEYGHNLGTSVIGGYVYRGDLLPELQGVYIYGDFSTVNLWAARRDESGDWLNQHLMTIPGRVLTSFGEDDNGELYMTDYNGFILRFEPANYKEISHLKVGYFRTWTQFRRLVSPVPLG